MKYIVVIFLILTNCIWAGEFLEENTEKLNWNGIDVIWLKNDKLPLYEVNVYFADGALGDSRGKFGETQMMFDQITSGTLQYNQKQIADIFEFYGTSLNTTVTHEFSSLKVGGMTKDLVPTMKMVCHLFSNATFPSRVLKSYKTRLKTSLRNLVNSKGELADRVFREISLKSSPYTMPVNGKLSSIAKISSSDLTQRLKEFNNNAYKRIYISGPESIKSLEKVIKKDCNWSGKSNFVRTASNIKEPTLKDKPLVYFLPIKLANQVQIRVGRLIKPNNDKNEREYLAFASSFLGGGFTSTLMQELRVKRGLTYSVSAFAAYQRDYGRAVISTFTKNKTIAEALNVIKDVLTNIKSETILAKELDHKKNYISGQHLFSFEDSSAILGQLMQLDHVKKDYNTIYQFPEIVKGITADDLASEIHDSYNWNKQTIVIIGAPEIEKDLRKIGKVQKINLKDYL